MSREMEPLTFATQGGEHSYHAVAARAVAGDRPVVIEEHREFGKVVRASRAWDPGLGVIAISTIAGTVEKSAKEIVRKRPSALPPIVGRVDLNVELAIIGSRPQTIEEIGRQGVKCLAQKPAWMQSLGFINEHLPWIKRVYRGESTEAIQEVIDRDDPRYVAIGPSFAAELMGGHIIGPDQINPPNSVTSFYVLQRDIRQKLLPDDPEKTSQRTIIRLAYPEGENELDKCWVQAAESGITISRFIPFAIGDLTKHNPRLRRGGGLLEVVGDVFDPEITEFCAYVNGLKANDGTEGPFDTNKLGAYPWYEEPEIKPEDMIGVFPSVAETPHEPTQEWVIQLEFDFDSEDLHSSN
jgi:prephenate dehydratase